MHQSTTPSLSDYLIKMGIKTVPHPPYSPDIAPCDFCLFPKLRGCCHETIEEMKEAVTKVIDKFTKEDFHGVLQKLLERYKCIEAGGDYFEVCVLSIKVPIRKKSGNYLISLVYNKLSSYLMYILYLFQNLSHRAAYHAHSNTHEHEFTGRVSKVN